MTCGPPQKRHFVKATWVTIAVLVEHLAIAGDVAAGLYHAAGAALCAVASRRSFRCDTAKPKH
jgi:hypothetical protein